MCIISLKAVAKRKPNESVQKSSAYVRSRRPCLTRKKARANLYGDLSQQSNIAGVCVPGPRRPDGPGVSVLFSLSSSSHRTSDVHVILPKH